MMAVRARSEYCSLMRRLEITPGGGPGLWGGEACLDPSNRDIQYGYSRVGVCLEGKKKGKGMNGVRMILLVETCR